MRVFSQNMIKAANETDKQQTIVKLQEQSKKTLEQEILNYRDEAQKQRKIIYQLEKERDRYINEASEFTKKVEHVPAHTYTHKHTLFHIVGSQWSLMSDCSTVKNGRMQEDL